MQKLRQFMVGRYGGDRLNIALLVIGLVFSLVARLFFRPLFILADILYIYALFRMFSRNIPARQRENMFFYNIWSRASGWFNGKKRMISQRGSYKYFKCPNCRQKLRAPRGRGKIEVTCQRCHTVFRTKT